MKPAPREGRRVDRIRVVPKVLPRWGLLWLIIWTLLATPVLLVGSRRGG
jgi:hypothetical protein